MDTPDAISAALSAEPENSQQKLPVLTPRQRDWLMTMAYLHLEQRKPDPARVLLRIVYRALPEDAEVQRCLALAELLAGSPGAAARAATRAFKQCEDRHRVPVGLVFAKALWEQGQHEAARDFLASLLHHDRR